MKKQKHYTEAELIRDFGLKKIQPENSIKLMTWQSAISIELKSVENEYLNEVFEKLKINVDTWNEEELKMKFVSPLLEFFVKYNSDKYNSYFEREISAVVQDRFLKVKTDFMIAKGILDLAENPYFCFHEYKRSKKNADDPAAQVLEAMLIAQEINKNGKPIYGVYIIGGFWYFMVMQGSEYAISQPYIATKKEELLQIIAILRHFKIILERDLLD
jgi:hypothetical protein